MHVQDQIIEFLKVIGPTLPSKVAKNIKTDILLASAHLSDLASQGKVRISSLKVGGSPLYYFPGQESQLYPFAAGNINSKELQVLERLKNEKVLQEANLDLLSKVALRSLNDFAIPLQVNIGGDRYLFWKWHLLAPEETDEIIAKILKGSELKAADRADSSVTSDIAPTLVQQKEEIALEVESERQKTALFQEGKRDSNLWKNEVNDVEKEERQQKLEISNDKESKKEIESEYRLEGNLEKVVEGKKVSIKRIRRKKKSIPDTFLPAIRDFFAKLEIKIEKQETVRKNSEINFLVDVHSVVGTLRYFCKAKMKQRCNEKDLSAAYIEAQMKKLPLLFLYSQQISKKAELMLESYAFENVVAKKIE